MEKQKTKVGFLNQSKSMKTIFNKKININSLSNLSSIKKRNVLNKQSFFLTDTYRTTTKTQDQLFSFERAQTDYMNKLPNIIQRNGTKYIKSRDLLEISNTSEYVDLYTLKLDLNITKSDDKLKKKERKMVIKSQKDNLLKSVYSTTDFLSKKIADLKKEKNNLNIFQYQEKAIKCFKNIIEDNQLKQLASMQNNFNKNFIFRRKEIDVNNLTDLHISKVKDVIFNFSEKQKIVKKIMNKTGDICRYKFLKIYK